MRKLLLFAFLLLSIASYAKKKDKVYFYLPPHVSCKMDTTKWAIPYLTPTAIDAQHGQATLWTKDFKVGFHIISILSEELDPVESANYLQAQKRLASGGKQDLLISNIGAFEVFYYDSKAEAVAIFTTASGDKVIVKAFSLEEESKNSLFGALKKWIATFREVNPADIDNALGLPYPGDDANKSMTFGTEYSKRVAYELNHHNPAIPSLGKKVSSKEDILFDLISVQSKNNFSFARYFEQRIRAAKYDLTKDQMIDALKNESAKTPIGLYLGIEELLDDDCAKWMGKLNKRYRDYTSDSLLVWTPRAKGEATENDDQVVTFAEEMPVFMGGDEALYKYLSSALQYPQDAIESEISGTVIVSFVVNKKGQIRDVTVERNPSGSMSLAAEAVRVVKAMPLWKPAKQKGKPVNCKFMLPIKFALK